MSRFLHATLRCSIVAPIAACLLSAGAYAADADAGRKPAADKKTTAAKAGSAQKRPESSGDRPDVMERASGRQHDGGKPIAGSAVGQTGGPAATDGHTGSTTNSSNSPRK